MTESVPAPASSPAPPPRAKVIIGLNIISFSWSVGLGASIPLIPLFAYQFVPNLALAGVVTAIGGVGSIFASYITGILIDRMGRRGVTAFGIALRMVFSFAEGLPRNIYELAFYRFMSAVGTSIYGAGSQVIMADISTRQDRGSLFGGRQSFSHIGNILGPIIGGWVWGRATPLMGPDAIRLPFFINGFSKLICLITFLTMVAETKAYAAEPAAPAAGAAAPLEQTAPRQQAAPVGTRLPVSALVKAIFATGFFFVIYEVFATTLFRQGITNVILPVYSRHVLQLSQEQVGIIISAISMGNLISSFPAGYIADHWGVRWGILPGVMVSVAALVMFAAAGTGSVPLAVAMGIGTSLTNVGGRAFAVDIAPRASRGQFFGIQSSAGNFAQLLGPLLIGGVTDRLGFGFPFMFLAVLYAVMIPMCLTTVRDAPAATPASAPEPSAERASPTAR